MAPEERANLLIKEDVEWPVSADRDVWPSYFLSPSPIPPFTALKWFGQIALPSVAERVIIVDPEEVR
jgi:hypothetical protein